MTAKNKTVEAKLEGKITIPLDGIWGAEDKELIFELPSVIEGLLPKGSATINHVNELNELRVGLQCIGPESADDVSKRFSVALIVTGGRELKLQKWVGNETGRLYYTSELPEDSFNIAVVISF